MSNLLKQCFVVNSTEGKRIINSNRRMEESLMKNESGEHMQQNDASEFDDTKSEKELIPTYEEEKVRLEQLRKEMMADAQTMANQMQTESLMLQRRVHSSCLRTRESLAMKKENNKVCRSCRSRKNS